MAIRKDLDDMLNNLKANNAGAVPPKTVQPAAPPVHKPNSVEQKIDHMSVDDLLSTLSHEKDTTEQAAPMPAPEPAKKKRIVISGDLPDYEALRQAELEKDRAEAERRRLEAERMAAAREAEIRRAEAEKRAAEEAERARLEAEKKAAEEAERQRLEAEKKAAEEADRRRLEAAKKAAEEAAAAKAAFAPKPAAPAAPVTPAAPEAPAAPAGNSYSFEEEINVLTSSQTEDSLGGEPTVDELMAAAFAAVKAEAEEIEAEPEAEEAEEVAEAPAEEEPESDPVGSMIDTIREDAEKKMSELEETAEPEEEAPAEEPEEEPAEESDEDKAEERRKRFFEKKKESDTEAETEEAEKPKGKLTSALEKIMDEDPDEIIAERSEKAEDDEFAEQGSGKLKKRLYTIFGIVFAVLACVGLITVIATAAKMFGRFTSGDSKKTGFADVVYPAVIMDIESFDEPSQLTSDQVITAAIWSMIMSDGTLDNYEKTFDVVRVPAVDVESYAVKLFGDDLPELTHTTVGPAESRFYYNEEKESYNIPLTPVTFTYSPEIKSVTKNGSEYTLVVDYIDELPEWLPKTSSKSVQFTLAETSEGYQIKAMKVLSENNNI
ncbi:MAG: hypothetical protein Q4A05_04600 [Ruminococcus sp.]|nr:hypothetical protein [Ruminococcus sp.]